MSYSGTYKPTNPRKYKGNPTNIIYRSLWERKFMFFCDHTDNIVEWGSEEVVIPYKSPIDGRFHRYYPDFYIKVRSKSAGMKKYIIEVKPKKQVKGPVEKPKRKTAAWRRDVFTYMKNRAKWDAAEDYCKDRQMKFLILTEDHLAIKKYAKHRR